MTTYPLDVAARLARRLNTIEVQAHGPRTFLIHALHAKPGVAYIEIWTNFNLTGYYDGE